MYAQQLGFSSSWKMLTRDPGWMKPLCILALVGWIPILGQIAVLGYAFEWARLTAWGVDATPKQRGVDYGKVLATGGRAFVVLLTMGIAVGLVVSLLLGHGFRDIFAFIPSNMGFISWFIDADVARFSRLGLIGLLLSLVVGAVMLAAMMRTTLYDSFSAGWRLDRIFQMIGRDVSGFLKLVFVVVAGAFFAFVYVALCFLLFGTVMLGGFFSMLADTGLGVWHGGMSSLAAHSIYRLLSLGIGPVLLVILLGLLALFAYGIVVNAMQLVAVNACGQWFCRFAVDRWGLSSDPLPEGVPVGREGHASPFASGAGSAPTPPSAAAGSAPAAGNNAGSYWDDPDAGVSAGTSGQATPAGERGANAPTVDQAVAADAPTPAPSTNADASSASTTPHVEE